MLVERTSKYVAQIPLYQYELDSMKLDTQFPSVKASDDFEKKQEKIAIAKAELHCIVQLNSIYFGPKTNKALRELQKLPWISGVKQEDFDPLFRAMGDELMYFPVKDHK